MIVYVLQRLLGLVPVLFGITVVIFLTMKLIPGDVARALLGPMATDQSLAQLRHALGLDQAIHVQYVKWLWRALHGDLGLSPIVHKPVVELLLPKFGNTLILAGASFALAVLGGVAVGVLAASRQQTVVDRAAMGASLVIGNMPPFWLGLVLIVFFASRTCSPT
jgi:peptide/nickel transport system permease protein